MTQLNSKSIKKILQEGLDKDGDFLREFSFQTQLLENYKKREGPPGYYLPYVPYKEKKTGQLSKADL